MIFSLICDSRHFWITICMYVSRFRTEDALVRIASFSPDVHAMEQQAASEALLLNRYNVHLSAMNAPTSDDIATSHKPSEQLLRCSNPWLLLWYIPVDVGGDGNCLFRSVSYALYGNEDYHHPCCVCTVLLRRYRIDRFMTLHMNILCTF